MILKKLYRMPEAEKTEVKFIVQKLKNPLNV